MGPPRRNIVPDPGLAVALWIALAGCGGASGESPPRAVRALEAAPETGPRDHGPAAPVAEGRGLLALTTKAGTDVAVLFATDQGPRGWVLLVDLGTGASTQIFLPEGVPNEAPFASLLSSRGLVYTFAGDALLELDPAAGRFTFHGVPLSGETGVTGTALAEGPDGVIYAGTHPSSALVSFDPASRRLTNHGTLDSLEQYVNSLAVDDAGWVAAGIGTARQDVVLMNPKTGERRAVARDADRVGGSGEVFAGRDGEIYGRAGATWYRLHGGRAAPIPRDLVPPPRGTGAISWTGRFTGLTSGRRVDAVDLPGGWLTVVEPGGAPRRIALPYRSEGAPITCVATTPDGRVLAGTGHPQRFAIWDPARGTWTALGGIPRLGGGNFPALAVQGNDLWGAAYPGGLLYRLRVTNPDTLRAELVGTIGGDIDRPRACVVAGGHVVVAGHPGYGRVDGGIALYDTLTGALPVYPASRIVPDQSTVSLVVLTDGDVLGGTSVTSPGGGHTVATEAVLYRLRPGSGEVIYRAAPVPGTGAVTALARGRGSLVCGLSWAGAFFVFDPATREVVHRADLSAHGVPFAGSLLRVTDRTLAVLLTNTVLLVDLDTYATRVVAALPRPAGAGSAIAGGRLYYAVDSHLWSVPLPEAP